MRLGELVKAWRPRLRCSGDRPASHVHACARRPGRAASSRHPGEAALQQVLSDHAQGIGGEEPDIVVLGDLVPARARAGTGRPSGRASARMTTQGRRITTPGKRGEHKTLGFRAPTIRDQADTRGSVRSDRPDHRASGLDMSTTEHSRWQPPMSKRNVEPPVARCSPVAYWQSIAICRASRDRRRIASIRHQGLVRGVG